MTAAIADDVIISPELSTIAAAIQRTEAEIVTLSTQLAANQRALVDVQRNLADVSLRAARGDGDAEHRAAWDREHELKRLVARDGAAVAELQADLAEWRRQQSVIEANTERERSAIELHTAAETLVTAGIRADEQVAAAVQSVEHLCDAFEHHRLLAAKAGQRTPDQLPIGLALSTHFCSAERLTRRLGTSIVLSFGTMVAAGRLQFTDLISYAADAAEPDDVQVADVTEQE